MLPYDCASAQPRRVFRGWSRTNAGGGGDKVDKPEENVGAAQLAWRKHDDGEQQRQKEEDGELFHHLGNQVCYRPVEPIIALPAPCTSPHSALPGVEKLRLLPVVKNALRKAA